MVAAVSFGRFALHTVDVATYPWDWDPGEWGSIDAAHRLVQAPATLYPGDRVIPIPQTYGPTLAMLLVPVLRLSGNPYLAARLMMFAIALASALAAYVLVRKTASRPVAWLSSALIVAPFDQSFWYVLVRVDGVMIALWLWAAVVALPHRLRRGTERLSWRRAWLAGALLACATMTKMTALVFAAAMVGGWLLVNARSALRLATSFAATSALLLLLLQWLTHGGFLATVLLQRYLPHDAAQIPLLVAEALRFNWESVVMLMVALVSALRRRNGAWLDGAWILWSAGPLVLPFLAKIGAVFSYLLPCFAGQAILIGRLLGTAAAAPAATGTWCAHADTTVRRRQLVLAMVVGFIAARHPFPSPSAQDRVTAKTFFGFVKARGKPLLAALPQCTYGEVGQTVEAGHTDFMAFLRAGLPGTGDVVQKVRSESYHLLVGNHQDMRFEGAPYRPVGFCDLRFYYGLERLTLLVPRSSSPSGGFTVLPGARCRALEPKP